MISLKKYLDLDPSELKQHLEDSDPSELFLATVSSFRTTLNSFGSCCAQVYPALGRDLQLSLGRLAERLSKKVTPATVKEIEQRAEEQLQQWGVRSAEYFKNKTNEVKEILIVLARTAESAADRDQRHSSQFTDFTTRLESIADLEDLTQIRSSILQSANELKTCVDKMAQDNRDSLAQLRSQVVVYQTKLEEVEKQTSKDAVTGLDSRRTVESKIERRISDRQTFCLVMFDLNGFKQVNDTHGHLAGDDLLKQFATEMRSASRATDVIGRWGGDEFVIILDCRFNEAQTHIERMQKWVFGDYEIQAASGPTKIHMTASVGLTEHLKGETMKELIGRADAAMYKEKAAKKKK